MKFLINKHLKSYYKLMIDYRKIFKNKLMIEKMIII